MLLVPTMLPGLALLAGAAGAPLRPTWSWSWDTLGVWVRAASPSPHSADTTPPPHPTPGRSPRVAPRAPQAAGQGVTDFSDEDARHFARFSLLWTQGMRWNPPPTFSGDYTPFDPPRPGYESWEAAVISDAKKVRALKPSLPVLGYYGWGGCCTGRNEWWLANYTDPSNAHLWLRDNTAW